MKCLNSLYEISGLSVIIKMTHIVPVVGHPHFGPDEDNLAIVDNHSAIVRYVLVCDWPDPSALDQLPLRKDELTFQCRIRCRGDPRSPRSWPIFPRSEAQYLLHDMSIRSYAPGGRHYRPSKK